MQLQMATQDSIDFEEIRMERQRYRDFGESMQIVEQCRDDETFVDPNDSYLE